MKSAVANLNWHLFVVCPHCDKTIDLVDSDYNCEGDISVPIFNNKWEDLEEFEVECEHCKQTFEISEVEY